MRFILCGGALVALCVLVFAALLVFASDPTLPFVAFMLALGALVKWGN